MNVLPTLAIRILDNETLGVDITRVAFSRLESNIPDTGVAVFRLAEKFGKQSMRRCLNGRSTATGRHPARLTVRLTRRFRFLVVFDPEIVDGVQVDGPSYSVAGLFVERPDRFMSERNVESWESRSTRPGSTRISPGAAVTSSLVDKVGLHVGANDAELRLTKVRVGLRNTATTIYMRFLDAICEQLLRTEGWVSFS